MNQNLLVTKRDGSTERINLDKIHRVLDWAAEGLHNVSISQVELRSHIQFYDGIKTSDIHETIIKAAADLISFINKPLWISRITHQEYWNRFFLIIFLIINFKKKSKLVMVT